MTKQQDKKQENITPSIQEQAEQLGSTIVEKAGDVKDTLQEKVDEMTAHMQDDKEKTKQIEEKKTNEERSWIAQKAEDFKNIIQPNDPKDESK